jgi:hypothetical protein
MITSENVKFVKNFAEASDGVGARVVGNRLFVTTTKDLVVYDVSDPPNPKRLATSTRTSPSRTRRCPRTASSSASPGRSVAVSRPARRFLAPSP